MRKSKFMKALLLLGMSAITATSIAFTACGTDGNSDDTNDPTGHQHTWSEYKTDANQHWKECTAEGHEGDVKGYAGDHVWDNDQDTECNTCGYTRTVGGGPGGGDEENPNPGETKETVTVNVGDLTVGTIADGNDILANSGLKALGGLAVDANKKDVVYKGQTIQVANRIKLTKKITDKAATAIAVNLEADATVIVYGYSATGGSNRGLALYDADKNLVPDSSQILSDGNCMGTHMFSVKANTQYYIGLIDSGVNIYYMAVVYGDIGETWEHHDVAPSQCGVKGNIEYSVSNYGRYKNASDTYIIGSTVELPALTHSYTYEASDITAPTADAVGSVTLHCSNGHNTVAELPELTSSRYTVRPEAGVEGTYTLTVEGGVAVSFTATGIGAATLNWNDVYKLENFSGVTVGSSKTAGANCVYATSGTASVNATGALQCGEATNATAAYISVGNTISTGVVKITGTITVKSTNGKWTFFQILNSEDKEFIGFRTGSGAWGYRAGGTGEPSTLPIASATSTEHTFEITIDFGAKTVTAKVDNITLTDNTALTNKADATVTDFSSIYINCNGGRYVDIGSITIQHAE